MTEAEDAFVPVPSEFFEDLLARTADLAELKVILYLVHVSSRRGTPGVSLHELMTPSVLGSVVGGNSPEPAEKRFMRAVDRAVVNGLILRVVVSGPEGHDVRLLPSTARNRLLLERLRADDEEASRELDVPANADASIFRPNVFAFYEHHIGPLTPLVAEQLRDAERSYPRQWIEEAIRTAVHYNKRNWRYVEAVLTNWETRGAPDGIAGRRS